MHLRTVLIISFLSAPFVLAREKSAIEARHTGDGAALSTGQLAGIIGASVGTIIICIAAILFYYFRIRKRKKDPQSQDPTKEATPDVSFTSSHTNESTRDYDVEAGSALNVAVNEKKQLPGLPVSKSAEKSHKSHRAAGNGSYDSAAHSQQANDHYSRQHPTDSQYPDYSRTTTPSITGSQAPSYRPSVPFSSQQTHSNDRKPQTSPRRQPATLASNSTLNAPPSFSSKSGSTGNKSDGVRRQRSDTPESVAVDVSEAMPPSFFRDQQVPDLPAKPANRFKAMRNTKKPPGLSVHTEIENPSTNVPKVPPKDDKKPGASAGAANRVAAWRQNLLRSAGNSPTPDSEQNKKDEDSSATVLTAKANRGELGFLAVDPHARASVAVSNFPDDTTEGTSFLPGMSVAGLGPVAPAATIASTTGSVTGDLAWILSGGQVHHPATLGTARKAASPSVYTASTVGGVAPYGLGPMIVPIPELHRSNSTVTTKTVATTITTCKKRPTSDALTLPSYYTNRPNTPTESTSISIPPLPGSPMVSSDMFLFPDMEDAKSTMSGSTELDLAVQPRLIGIGMTPSTRRRMDRNKMTLKDFDKLLMLHNAPPVPQLPDYNALAHSFDLTPECVELPGTPPAVELPATEVNPRFNEPSQPHPPAADQLVIPSLIQRPSSSPASPPQMRPDPQRSISTDQRPIKTVDIPYKGGRKVGDWPHDSPIESDHPERFYELDEVEEDGAGDISVHSAALEMFAHRQRERTKRQPRPVRRGGSSAVPSARTPSGRWQPLSPDGVTVIESDDVSPLDTPSSAGLRGPFLSPVTDMNLAGSTRLHGDLSLMGKSVGTVNASNRHQVQKVRSSNALTEIPRSTSTPPRPSTADPTTSPDLVTPASTYPAPLSVSPGRSHSQPPLQRNASPGTHLRQLQEVEDELAMMIHAHESVRRDVFLGSHGVENLDLSQIGNVGDTVMTSESVMFALVPGIEEH